MAVTYAGPKILFLFAIFLSSLAWESNRWASLNPCGLVTCEPLDQSCNVVHVEGECCPQCCPPCPSINCPTAKQKSIDPDDPCSCKTCVGNNRGGECPPRALPPCTNDDQDSECDTDEHCQGNKKCCPGSCGKECVDVVSRVNRGRCTRRLACSLEYNPVCGSDGKTYSNICFLNNAMCKNKRLQKVSDGACAEAKCPPRVFDPCIFQSHNRDECLEDFHCKRGQVCCPGKCALECVYKQ